MTKNEFIEQVYEIAFGDDAINREFTDEQVITELMRLSDLTLCRHITKQETCGCQLGQCVNQ